MALDNFYTFICSPKYNRSYFYGISNDYFTLGGTMTCAMFATILYCISVKPEVTDRIPSDDAEESDKRYIDAMIWAAQDKIIDGYGSRPLARPSIDLSV